MDRSIASGSVVNSGAGLIFTETHLKGAYLVEPERQDDDRGFFARTWCQREFARRGLNPHLVQCNISFNHRKGTWRGMHYQVPPHEEAKLVRCTQGSICDVIVDLRPDSRTFRNHVTVTLSAENRQMLYIPETFAHGFITLQENTEVFYQMSEFYSPEYARGFRWNDPSFDIRLPVEVTAISERDRDYADF
jgi:dTDP-4-dehydrorhamnose 3,5-epimerase